MSISVGLSVVVLSYSTKARVGLKYQSQAVKISTNRSLKELKTDRKALNVL